MARSVRDYTCCFTGHRALPPEERGAIAYQLEQTVIMLIQAGIRFFAQAGPEALIRWQHKQF